MNTWKGEVVVPTWEDTSGAGPAYGPDVEDTWTQPGQWAHDETGVDAADVVAAPEVMVVYAEADQAWFDQWETVIWCQPITYADPQGRPVSAGIRLANAQVTEADKERIFLFMLSKGLTEEQERHLKNILVGRNGTDVAKRITDYIREIKGYPPL